MVLQLLRLLLSTAICGCLVSVIESAVSPTLHKRSHFWSENITDPILKIGSPITLDIKAKNAAYGMDMYHAWEMYFDWHFRAKGMITVNGTKYSTELVVIDDRGDEITTKAATQQLLQVEGVRHFFAPYSTLLAEATAKLTSPADAFMISPGASGVSVYKNRTAFSILGPSTRWLDSTFQALAAADGGSPKTVMSVKEDVAFHHTLCGTIPALAAQNNMTILAGTITARDTGDWEDEMGRAVRNFSALQPDIVIGCVYPQSCRALLHQMRKQRYSPKAVVVSLCITEGGFIEAMTTSGQYVIGMTPWAASLPLKGPLTQDWTAASFDKEFTNRYGTPPSYQAASAFAGAALMLHAIQNASSADPQALPAVLKKSSVMSMFGPLAFGDNNMNTAANFVVQFQGNSQMRIVHPQGLDGQVPLVYPKPDWQLMECLDSDVSSKCRFGFVNGSCVECTVGTFAAVVNGSRHCVQCSSGTFGSEAGGYVQCVSCPKGLFNAELGSKECILCPAGTYAAASGSTDCKLASPGYMVQDKGSSLPVRCPAGFIAPVSGAAQCKPCDVGSYQGEAGQSVCTACRMLDSNTVSQGATSPSECVCGQGSFAPLSRDRCLQCPEGLQCEVGSSLSAGTAVPHVLGGHYVEFKNASEGASISVYMCKPAEACPGGKLAEQQYCADRRTGFLCTQCPKGTYASGAGCKDCSGGSYAVIAILAVLLLALFLLVTVVGGRMHPAAASPHASAGLKTLGLALMFLQTVGAIYNIGISWKTPFKDVGAAVGLLNFDIDIINIGCVRAGGPARIYILKMVLPLVGIALMSAMWFMLRVLNIGNLSFDGVLNGVGSVLTIFYITQTVAAFSPYSCFPHPNGELSMTWAPEVLCNGDGLYSVLVGVSVFGVLAYPVTVFAVTAFAVLKYPYAIIGSNLRFVSRFGFIFSRWAPDCYWFGAVVLVRNFLVAVLPIIIPKRDYKLAILLVELVLLMMVCMLMMYRPWKLSMLTSCDAGLNLGLLMLLAVGAAEHVSTTYSIVCTALFAACVLSTGILLLRCALRCVGGPTYDVFVSHHKKDAACCARLLKLSLYTKFTGGVFLDCDDLTFLGALFDQVKQSKVVVVILSGATLSRPWCLGEIAQAFLSKIKLVPVTFIKSQQGSNSLGNDERPKTEDEIAKLDGIATLFPFGISTSAIEKGLAELLSRPLWHIPVDSTSDFEGAVRRMNGDIASLESRSSHRMLSNKVSRIKNLVPWSNLLIFAKSVRDAPAADTEEPKVWLLTNHDSKEALAAARVIKFLFQKMAQLEVVLDVGYSAPSFLDAIKSVPSKGDRPSVLWTLTDGTLNNAKQMVRGMLLRRYRQASFTPVIVGDSFVFPAQDFFQTLSTTGGPFGATATADLSEAAGEEVKPADVAATLQSIFSNLAVVVNVPGASEAMLKQSLNTMILRIASQGEHKHAAAGAANATPTSGANSAAVANQAAPPAPDAADKELPAVSSASAAVPAEDQASVDSTERWKNWWLFN